MHSGAKWSQVTLRRSKPRRALLRANQEQHSRMPPPNTNPTGAGGVIGNTPFVQPLSTPSIGMRTRELHGPGYYHIGSPADQGYAEHMRAINIGSRIVPIRRIDPRDTSMQRMLKFGSTKVPKLSKANLVNKEVHLLIQHIHRLLSQETFDDSVLSNLIDNETITLLGYVFAPTEAAFRNPITTHWTIDWDVAAIIKL